MSNHRQVLRRLRNTVLWVVVSCFLTSLATEAYEPARVMKLSGRDRIALLVQLLTDAMNDPSKINLDMLEVALPEDRRDEAKNRLKTLGITTTDRSGRARMSLEETGITLQCKTDQLVETPFGFSGQLKVIARGDFGRLERSVPMSFVKHRRTYIINDPVALMRETEELISVSVEKSKNRRPDRNFATNSKTVATDTIHSDDVFKPVELNNGYAQFGNVASLNDNSGQQLFSRPSGIMSLHTVSTVLGSLNRDLLIVGDAGWNRYIASSHTPGHQIFTSVGQFGTGPKEFKHPNGIASNMRYWLIADGNNKCAKVYELDYWNDSLEYKFSLADSFNFPIDVAVAFVPTSSGYDTCQMWVVDRAKSNVSLFNCSGDVVKRYFSFGWMADQVKNPTSVCVGRNYVTQQPADWIYVADAGNRRVILQMTKGQENFINTRPDMFPQNAYLSSVDVDAFGTVYVADEANSCIYVLSPSLQELIAIYGSEGSGANQLYYPKTFKIAEGWIDSTSSLTPMVMGDAFVTEHWGDYTGVRRYELWGNKLAHTLIYEPQHSAGSNDYFRVKWKSSGVDNTVITISCQGNVLQQQVQGLNLPAWHNDEYLLELSDPDSVYYVAEVKAYSKFTGQLKWSFIDSLYIERSVDSSYEAVSIMVEGFTIQDVSSFISGSGQALFPLPLESSIYNESCLWPDSSKIWYASTNAYGFPEDTFRIFYNWQSGQPGVQFSIDPILYGWQDYIIGEDRKSVFFRFTDSSIAKDTAIELFRVQYQDTVGQPLAQCQKDAETKCYHVGLYINMLYTDAASTPCAEIPCCLNRGNVDRFVGPGGPIDVSDNTYLLAYLFQGGPPPPCPEEGNVDELEGPGGPIDVSDMTYLVAYLFQGGALPPPCTNAVAPNNNDDIVNDAKFNKTERKRRNHE